MILCLTFFLCLTFWSNTTLFSTEAASFYIPTHDAQGVQFLHVFANTLKKL